MTGSSVTGYSSQPVFPWLGKRSPDSRQVAYAEANFLRVAGSAVCAAAHQRPSMLSGLVQTSIKQGGATVRRAPLYLGAAAAWEGMRCAPHWIGPDSTLVRSVMGESAKGLFAGGPRALALPADLTSTAVGAITGDCQGQ